MVELSALIDPVYIATVIIFIIGLQRMSHPSTARSGIIWAGAAMLIATIVTFLSPGLSNFGLMAIGIVIGGGFGYIAAKRVAMTDMPQMVAIYNGMGGGAAAGIAAVHLLGTTTAVTSALAVVGGLIGAVSFSGSIIAFLKLQGWMRPRPVTFPGQQAFNMAVLALAVASGILVIWQPTWMPAAFSLILSMFFLLSLGFGILMALPIGGADMPVVISLFNALTGLAVGLDGFSFTPPNYAMVIAGIIVGAAGSLLTLLMARAMNRSVSNILFGAFGATEETGTEIRGSMKPIEADDAAVMLAYSNTVIIVPGYGMAVAQAQQKVKELTDLLESRDIGVKFAIHPVAGRMPGHMNVLLAEAGISYDHLFDRDEINQEFPDTDVVLVIGANDVVNPAAHREGSPLFGMPILDVERAKNVIVLKRGAGKGFAGIENDLFYRDNTRMLYGDAKATIGILIQALKKL
ncbi:MAG TPA: NAD(P)(+) transhydrogenase (Re/Si-specific) subunit beta [Methanoregulaceae archaeon]|nr:MAG: NAD(P)(+) transhydrogenase (Re/Si-specific) subunit beta [Methanolinea sp.]HON80863.1 NAD(P)(+) transhydrogenase (Re/Si-specific) subunit beta [Methanoregulaceae archaeon]HPD09599.1 NAD(P)(+) transhydrogenase (Re/Si-specific) subunit beta [Methanoregulaceae archaeon]HRT15269.1 NAD(P)(+) transhydrogenase (Re/Si-specific) subunit beta [Methanoregulaceae archaeon]HRU30840.1 NAD(P)(+) transhydrogenase (Re/Si-specific) subunit beta [Methanoregulaceae archaeon]